MAFNKVILMGRLVSVPELKQTQNGMSVTAFTLAVDRRFSGKEEERKTDFPTVVAFGKTAEFVRNYFTKGSPMLVCGELQTRTWKDAQGAARYATEVVAAEVSFCGAKSENATASTPRTESAAKREIPPTEGKQMQLRPADFSPVSRDEDLPF